MLRPGGGGRGCRLRLTLAHDRNGEPDEDEEGGANPHHCKRPKVDVTIACNQTLKTKIYSKTQSFTELHSFQ